MTGAGSEQVRRPVPMRWGQSTASKVYGRAKPLDSAVDGMLERHGGAKLVRWLAERPKAWAGWPTCIAVDREDIAERTRRLRAAGWPPAVRLGTSELRQVDVAVAHLRARRRLAIVGMLARVGVD